MMAEVSGEGVPGEAVETGALSPYPLHDFLYHVWSSMFMVMETKLGGARWGSCWFLRKECYDLVKKNISLAPEVQEWRQGAF